MLFGRIMRQYDNSESPIPHIRGKEVLARHKSNSILQARAITRNTANQPQTIAHKDTESQKTKSTYSKIPNMHFAHSQTNFDITYKYREHWKPNQVYLNVPTPNILLGNISDLVTTHGSYNYGHETSTRISAQYNRDTSLKIYEARK